MNTTARDIANRFIDTHDSQDAAEKVIGIHSLVLRIAKTQKPLFLVYPHKTVKFKSTPLGELVLLAIRLGFADIGYYFGRYCLHPYVELFIKQIRQANLDELIPYLELCQTNAALAIDVTHRLNGFIGSIRSEMKSPGFKAMVQNHKRIARDNDKSMIAYIDALFGRYARLTAVRLDLEYTEGFYVFKGAQIKSDLARLLNNTRSNKTLFEHLLGYVWKIEFGRQRGFHIHIILFFDGAKVKSGYTKADRIGRYWRDNITNGRGMYFNCHAQENRYVSLGIGIINHFDTALRANLIKAAQYLTKTDRYARLVDPEIKRTFGRGVTPGPKTETRGRPRRLIPESALHG